MPRRSRRERVPDPEDYIPEEDEFEDEEEEERPRRRKKRRSRDDEEEAAPRRRRRRSRDDEEEDDPYDEEEEDEEEERPRRRRRSRDDDDEEEAPRRQRRRSRDDDYDDEEEDDFEDEEDEDDEPRRRSSKKKGGTRRVSNRNSGWGGYHKVKSETSNYADKLQVSKIRGEVVVKFLDPEPFGSYGLHWFDAMDGKKGWLCLESVGEDECPGCDVGDRPMPKAIFNVIVFDDDGDPTLKVLDAGTRLTGQLEKLSEVKGGLTGHYWSVTAGPKGSGTANFQRIKERDLEEDYDIIPLDDDELDEFEEDRHVLADVEQIPSYKDFRDAIREIED